MTICGETSEGFKCTLPRRHDGDHEAWDLNRVCKKWPLGADKFDDGKPPLALLPPEALEEVARVLGYGARKYSAWNHREGFAWSRMLSSALRHLSAFNAGEDDDPESGLSHIAHAVCQLLFLQDHIILNLGRADRSWTPPR